MTTIESLVSEIRQVMATHIPAFEQKFSVDFTETAINEVRTAKSFEIQNLARFFRLWRGIPAEYRSRGYPRDHRKVLSGVGGGVA